MRKITVAGYGFIERLGADESLLLVKNAGFDGIDYPLYEEDRREEFSLDGGSDPAAAARVRSVANSLGLSVGQTHAPFGYRADDGSTQESILDIYKRAAEATAMLGAKGMVLHPVKFEDCKYGYRREECFDLNLELFSRLAPFLKGCGVIGLLENMFIKEQKDGFSRLVPTIYSTGEELSRAARMLGEQYAVCLDSGHALITGEDIPAMVRTIGDKLFALHLHDNTRERDDHLPPYFGKLPFASLLDALKEIKYSGNLNFEVRFTSVPKGALPTALKYVRDIGVTFRQMLDGE